MSVYLKAAARRSGFAKYRDFLAQRCLRPTSVTLIVGTLRDALPQQVCGLPQPVALRRLRHWLLEKEAIPACVRTGEDRGTDPYGTNDSLVPVYLRDEP
ncbi:hypothetical protein PBY51_014417 [Eleginops maclovinus]|uniref:Uncharacterized protein n=1 Tax=Eleginops maclovinus TaxID=56733 RepID=A0AAN7WVN8_ELEMC|nr:hypothetical protein PBY51_014417 [Eleginops maclovinus]